MLNSKLRQVIMICAIIMLGAFTMYGQFSDSQPPKDWFHLDYVTDSYRGVSSARAYAELLKGKSSETVIVAVIDSGIDYEHEDLKSVMWVNSDEIPGNGKDDDNNGYVDDIHGWNFIGGADGENVNADNLEITRLYRKYKMKFGDREDASGLRGKDKKLFAKYTYLRDEYNKNRDRAKSSYDKYKEQRGNMTKAIKAVETALGKKKFNLVNIEALEEGANEELAMGKQISTAALSDDPDLTAQKIKAKIIQQFKGALDYFESQFEHHYNIGFDPRPIVGDNYADLNEKDYGNNSYEGPDAAHGTHVAGIIGAARGNNVGMDGIADNVQIMSIRAVPDGDEHDKDVANAIRYAVDNGASIINMSFGKGFGWNKNVVDQAVKYAQSKDVLLVHAAGNDGKNNDTTDNFPNDDYEKKGLFKPGYCKTWIEVGALNWRTGENYPAPFSNYGIKNVDVFAPGMAIYSTIPDDEYASFQGTSMASPVVAGVAALLRSYYPKLTAKQVKQIIEESAIKINETVMVPGEDKKLPFNELSVTGGVVNAYNALRIAAKTKGKKKA